MKIIIEKGDSTEQVMMAEALLANGLVRAVERAEVKVGVVSKSNEEIARAVLEAARLFGVGAQWTAVYRVLVDYCGWDSDVAAFCRRMNLIINGAKLDYACNYQAIQKPPGGKCHSAKGVCPLEALSCPKGRQGVSKANVYSREIAEITFYPTLILLLSVEIYHLKVIK